MNPNNPTTPPAEDPNNVTPSVPATPPVETPAPASTTPPPPSVPTPPVAPASTEPDLSGIEDKVSKSVIEKIGQALGLTKKEEEQLPTDPKELLKLAQESGSEAAKKVLEDRDKEAKDAEEARESQIAEGAQRFQILWTGQYSELAESGRVPKIVNAQDVNDPGNIAKTKILLRMKQIIDENAKNNIDYVPTLKEVFYENPNILRNETVAGANVPVSGGGRSTTPNNGLAYDALNKTDIEDIVKKQYEN